MYYYFASTLPMLDFDAAPPFSLEEFDGECARLLSARDYQDARLALGLERGEACNRILRRWQKFYQALKNEIAWARASARQQNPVSVIRGARAFDVDITRALAEAGKAEHPLAAEQMLMSLQWRVLDDLALNREFTLEYILIYAVRLVILDRLRVFKTGEGSKRLEVMMEKAVMATAQ